MVRVTIETMVDNRSAQDCSEDHKAYTFTDLFREIIRDLARKRELAVPRFLNYPPTTEDPNVKASRASENPPLQDNHVDTDKHITTLACVFQHRFNVTPSSLERNEDFYRSSSTLSPEQSSSSSNSEDEWSEVDNKLTNNSKKELPPSTLESAQVALDTEGVNLGRFGSLDFVQIYLNFLKHTYVLDILVPGGRKAFDREHENGWSLRHFLESKILKIMWDPRQDQDAFWAHFEIKLGFTMCLQLVELVVRDRGRDRVLRMRLSQCIDNEREAWMKPEEVDKWVQANGDGRRYFRDHGYQVFAQRPVSLVALTYAAGDVDQMIQLWNHLYPRLSDEGKALVASETKKCLIESMLPDKPAGSGFAPETIQKLPIIPFAPKEEIERFTLLLYDDSMSSENPDIPTEDEEEMPEWKRRSRETVYRGSFGTAAEQVPETTKENAWDTWQYTSKVTIDSVLEGSGETIWQSYQ